MEKVYPTFLGIGAHKAGTSWLYKQLCKHHEIWMPPVKELHFFDRSLRYPSPNNLATSSPIKRIFGSKSRERKNVIAGSRKLISNIKRRNFNTALWWWKYTFGYYNEEWYSKLFSQSGKYKSCGEITPAYSILSKDDIAKIKVANPNIKIIFMIRNPIERAWSAIRSMVNRGVLDISLDSDTEIIAELKSKGLILRGDYERTLDNYLSIFGSHQLLICFYDAIQCDPIGLMSGITKFLEITSYNLDDIDSKTRINASPAHKMPYQVKEYLVETYSPLCKIIAERIGGYATTWDMGNDVDSIKPHYKSVKLQLPPTVHL